MRRPKPLPQQPHVPLVTVDPVTGAVSVPRPWIEWFQSADIILQLVAYANVVAANDAAAAAAGVPLGGLYQTSAGDLRIRDI
jgi:hypothetical protein